MRGFSPNHSPTRMNPINPKVNKLVNFVDSTLEPNLTNKWPFSLRKSRQKFNDVTVEEDIKMINNTVHGHPRKRLAPDV